MTSFPDPDITLDVNVRNPGQFFACCGLLELASRLWPATAENGWREPEGWFADDGFRVGGIGLNFSLDTLISTLKECTIAGLTKEQTDERANLDQERRRLKLKGKALAPELELRRTELGSLSRKGPIRMEAPFELLLDWWQSDDERIPKTWAGRQETGRVVRAAQRALRETAVGRDLFSQRAVLRDEMTKPTGVGKPVESFYFDARRSAEGRSVGYALDAVDAETVAFPAVELLCLIGLQRFRPKWVAGQFMYSTWSTPLPCCVGAAVSSGAISGGDRVLRFAFRFRDDQRRYKAFDFDSDWKGSK